jgi:hypothetical protein
MEKILIVVLSCYKNKHLWDNILKRIENNVIIFCGDQQQKEDYILENKILSLKCRDTYECLPEKIICMINSILNIDTFKDITHILKLDDHDTMFNDSTINILNHIIVNSKNSIDYAGQTLYNGYTSNGSWHLNKCSKNSIWAKKKYTGPVVPWIDGGCGYVLSKKSMNIINNKYKPCDIDTVYKTHIYEDIMIALILREKNILPLKIPQIIRGDKK